LVTPNSLEEPLGVGLVHPEVIVVDVDSSIDGRYHAEGAETRFLFGQYLDFVIVPPQQAATQWGGHNKE